MGNQVNCRVISPADNINIFQNACNNLWFTLILVIELIIQNYIIYAANFDLGSAIFGIAPLTMNQQITCYSLAVFVLILQPIVKKAVPLGPFETLVPKINIESDVDDNIILKWKAATQKAIDDRKKAAQEALIANEEKVFIMN